MTDLLALKNIIKNSGVTITAIADKLDVDRATVYNKLNGKNEFVASEIQKISEFLRLTNAERDKIFFATKV